MFGIIEFFRFRSKNRKLVNYKKVITYKIRCISDIIVDLYLTVTPSSPLINPLFPTSPFALSCIRRMRSVSGQIHHTNAFALEKLCFLGKLFDTNRRRIENAAIN